MVDDMVPLWDAYLIFTQELNFSIVVFLHLQDHNKVGLCIFWLIDSEDGRLSCGYSSFRGKRVSMEDFYDVKMSKIEGQTVCLFGIFDG